MPRISLLDEVLWLYDPADACVEAGDCTSATGNPAECSGIPDERELARTALQQRIADQVKRRSVAFGQRAEQIENSAWASSANSPRPQAEGDHRAGKSDEGDPAAPAAGGTGGSPAEGVPKAEGSGREEVRMGVEELMEEVRRATREARERQAHAGVAPQKQRVTVTIPEGMKGGEKLVVKVEGSREYEVRVPAHMKGGDTLHSLCRQSVLAQLQTRQRPALSHQLRQPPRSLYTNTTRAQDMRAQVETRTPPAPLPASPLHLHRCCCVPGPGASAPCTLPALLPAFPLSLRQSPSRPRLDTAAPCTPPAPAPGASPALHRCCSRPSPAEPAPCCSAAPPPASPLLLRQCSSCSRPDEPASCTLPAPPPASVLPHHPSWSRASLDEPAPCALPAPLQDVPLPLRRSSSCSS
eukprot:795366-Rhodomonas_salina.2